MEAFLYNSGQPCGKSNCIVVLKVKLVFNNRPSDALRVIVRGNYAVKRMTAGATGVAMGKTAAVNKIRAASAAFATETLGRNLKRSPAVFTNKRSLTVGEIFAAEQTYGREYNIGKKIKNTHMHLKNKTVRGSRSVEI